jgi:hypothetical protein
VKRDGAADCLGTLREAEQARTPRRVCPSHTVVAYGNAKGATPRLNQNVNQRGVRILGRVRQRLRDDVVRGQLNLLGQTRVDAHLQLNRDRRTAGKRLERRLESILGQDRRMNPMRDLAQLIEQVRVFVDDTGELCAELHELRRHHRFYGAHAKREHDQLLLEAVVQVALDATTGRVCDRDHLCHRERGAGCSTERAAGHQRTHAWLNR